MSLSKQVAEMFVARAKTQGLKGKARDRAAVDFMCGAGTAVAFAKGQESSEYGELSLLAFLVATRGYSEIERAAQS